MQAKSLAQHGYDVTIFGIRDWPEDGDSLSGWDGVRVVLFRSRVWAGIIAALALALPAALLASAFLVPGVDGLFDGSWPWSARVAALVSAGGVAAGLLLLANEYLQGRPPEHRATMWRVINTLGPLPRLGPIKRLTPFLRSRLVWPLLEKVSAIQIVARTAHLNPDVVHCHDIYTLHIGVRIKARSNAALIYDAHEIYEGKARRSRRDAKRYRRTLSRWAPVLDGIIVTNQDAARYYTKHYDGLPTPVVLPNARNRYGDVPYDGRIHRAAGLPPTQKILLFAGALMAERGLETLAEAGSRLPPDWSLVIMGYGDLHGRLEAIAEGAQNSQASVEMSETGRARILPPVPLPDLPGWICGATVGMIPYEATCLNHVLSLPNKLWDYASVGVPMLAKDLPLVTAAVDRCGMGWIIPSCAGPDDIAAAVSSLSETDIAAARKGCQRFMEQEGWAAYEARLFDLYRNVLSGTGARSSAPTALATRQHRLGTDGVRQEVHEGMPV